MARKAELYQELKKLEKKTKLSERNTIAEIEAAIAALKVETEDTEPTTEAGVEEKAVENSEQIDAEAHYAKAGKRSKKHEEEIQAELAKEERKATQDTSPQGDTPAEVKKGPAPKTRPKAERRGKKYRELAQQVDKTKSYTLDEAVKLAIATNPSKFDATVELHLRLGVDPKLADQNIRATVALPHGSGKTVRVAALVPAEDVESVNQAGADLAGEEIVLKALDKEEIAFDVLVATPTLMPKLGKYARLLGPKGLMPNPKSGTVSTNPAQAVREAKAGKVEYRVDKQSIVHLGIGKVSFGPDKLLANAKVFLDSLNAQKPSSLKANYILSCSIATSMGPGIKIQL
jgi:large subunit ribosomal protein L1